MFRKKIVNEINQWDKHMKILYDELVGIGWNMDKKVDDVYIKSKAVALYVEGSPDWKKAVNDRNEAQKKLHCSIGAYDDKRGEILRYAEVNYCNFNTHWSDTIDSHVWIEERLRHILKL